MAASLAGAIKQAIESAGLGVAVYRSVAPKTCSYPYVVIAENISSISAGRGTGLGSGTDPGALRLVSQEVEVNLWQDLDSESYDLPTRLYRALVEMRLGPIGVYQVDGHRVTGASRFEPAPKATAVRDRYSLVVSREI